MEDYISEIKRRGEATLEKFLLLLTEETILSEKRAESLHNIRNKHVHLIDETNKLMDSAVKLKNNEVTMKVEEFIKVKKNLRDYDQLSTSQYLASNSYFIYLFALFDQFILEIAKLSLKNNPTIMQNYKNYCISYFESGQDKNLYKILPYENQLIDYLSNFSSPISVITKILGIDFKKEIYASHYFNFIEMKERRNLIVHRGTFYDQLYFKTIKKYLSKFPQNKLNKFLSEIKKSENKNLDIDLRYFIETIKTLYFLVCIIVNSAILKNNSDKIIPIFTDPFNSLLNFSLENKSFLHLIPIPLELFSIYKSEDLKNDIKKISDIDKVIMILCNEKVKEYVSFLLEVVDTDDKVYIKNKEEQSSKLFKLYDDSIKDILDQIEDKLIKEIIKTFLEKNYQEFIENIFSFSKREKLPLAHIESEWYMLRKLSKDDIFMKNYISFKKKNKIGPEETKVKIFKNLN